MKIRVLLVDDDVELLEFLQAELTDRSYDVVAVRGGDEALAIARRDPSFDVALLDVRMPGLDGIDVVAALARYGPPVHVVLLSAFDDEHLIQAGLEAGAAAYVRKTADRDEICLDVAAAVRAGESGSPCAIHGTGDLDRGRLPGWAPRLTSAEHPILVLAHAGWDKPELALLTGVDEPMLRQQLDLVLAKFGADTLDEALAVALELNIIR